MKIRRKKRLKNDEDKNKQSYINANWIQQCIKTGKFYNTKEEICLRRLHALATILLIAKPALPALCPVVSSPYTGTINMLSTFPPLTKRQILPSPYRNQTCSQLYWTKTICVSWELKPPLRDAEEAFLLSNSTDRIVLILLHMLLPERSNSLQHTLLHNPSPSCTGAASWLASI